MPEYYVTFGCRYSDEYHPLWLGAHPDGWLTVEASSYLEARAWAFENLGCYWSDIDSDDALFTPEFYRLGELGRVVAPDGKLDGVGNGAKAESIRAMIIAFAPHVGLSVTDPDSLCSFTLRDAEEGREKCLLSAGHAETRQWHAGIGWVSSFRDGERP